MKKKKRNFTRTSKEHAIKDDRASVAQLVEHRVVMQEVVNSTPAGPTLRVLK